MRLYLPACFLRQVHLIHEELFTEVGQTGFAVTPGELGGRAASPAMWLGIAVIMLIPIVMVVLSLTLPYPAIGWVNIVVAVLVVVFNLVGLPYAGWHDNFLIIVSFVFNALTVWYAWTWVSAAA